MSWLRLEFCRIKFNFPMRLGSMTLEPLRLGPILRLQLTLVGEGIVCLGTYIMTVAYIRKILMELIGLNLRQNVISAFNHRH
jgi:hypothetical protein